MSIEEISKVIDLYENILNEVDLHLKLDAPLQSLFFYFSPIQNGSSLCQAKEEKGNYYSRR